MGGGGLNSDLTWAGLMPHMNVPPFVFSLLKYAPSGVTTRGQSVTGPSGHRNTNTQRFLGRKGRAVRMRGFVCRAFPMPAMLATSDAQGPAAFTRCLQWRVLNSPELVLT